MKTSSISKSGSGISSAAMSFRIPPSWLLDIDAGRICLIKPSALGDVVQTLPLLGMLRRRFPSATVSWVVRRDLADLVTGHPDLTEVIPFHRDGAWREWRQLLGLLRRRRFDLVFDLQGLFRTGIMTFATGAGVRVGLQTAREGANLACNCILPDSGRSVPAHQRYWRVAQALGRANDSRAGVVPATPADASWLAEQLRHLPRPIMAVHPGAGWETKRWPVEKFGEIARRFAGSVVIVGGPSERLPGSQIILATADSPKPTLNLAGQTTLKQLAVLLKAVDLLVTNDSGPLHLAAAVETPVVGIFTCTNPLVSGPAMSGPTGQMHELISTSVACAASYCKACPHSGAAHLACLAELSVERVWRAVECVLDKRRSTARPA
ncbi:MAG TPA: glycosyltransferase family 9 protein [Planctomycetaceae bacterium]